MIETIITRETWPILARRIEEVSDVSWPDGATAPFYGYDSAKPGLVVLGHCGQNSIRFCDSRSHSPYVSRVTWNEFVRGCSLASPKGIKEDTRLPLLGSVEWVNMRMEALGKTKP